MPPPTHQVAVKVAGSVKDYSEVELVLRTRQHAEVVQPIEGEVLIRIRMRTINPADGASHTLARDDNSTAVETARNVKYIWSRPSRGASLSCSV